MRSESSPKKQHTTNNTYWLTLTGSVGDNQQTLLVATLDICWVKNF